MSCNLIYSDLLNLRVWQNDRQLVSVLMCLNGLNLVKCKTIVAFVFILLEVDSLGNFDFLEL